MAAKPLRRTRVVLAALGVSLAIAATQSVAPVSASPDSQPVRPLAYASATAPDGYRAPPIKHVWMIVLENKSYEATFTGLNQNSYLWKTLPSYGVLLRQYYGIGHRSLDNYLALVSGQAPNPSTQNDCPTFKNVSPGTPAPDGQVYAKTGCVYPNAVGSHTLFHQLDKVGLTWKGYMQDMGNDPAREPATCGAPGSPAGAGVTNSTAPTTTDQYADTHNPFIFFHDVLDSPECKTNVVALDSRAASGSQPATTGLAQDLSSEATTPNFSWITPNKCDDAHDSTCVGVNSAGTHQGGLFAADAFLKKYIPLIMASPAYQDGGLIDITFDEALPPYKAYGNSIADLPAVPGSTNINEGKYPGNTAQSVVACCNELPGPNVYEPGAQQYGQDTTPGGGVVGSVLLSRYITPGTISDQPYNHYSWLRSMEDLFDLTTGGSDGKGHYGYAAAAGLRPFGPDVYNNPTGTDDQIETTPVASGTNGTFSGRSGPIASDSPPVNAQTGRPIPDSSTRPFPLPIPPNVSG